MINLFDYLGIINSRSAEIETLKVVVSVLRPKHRIKAIKSIKQNGKAEGYTVQVLRAIDS